ncbi:MAG: LTA synthase family protein, partial [candidate division Zixibacteria bacterium]|nr:LTA synthase family protein [candidate division Zixibacteria bacterium]
TRQTVTLRDTGNSEAVTTTENLPDIYYIVLDGYGGHDVLRDMYRYDNSNFLSSLTRKGFFVVDSSFSNYCATDQSLTATLNLDYLHNLGRFDPNSSDRMSLAELFADNTVCRFLKARGYSIGAFTTGLYLTRLSEADLYFTSGLTLSEFQNSIINMTPVAYLLRFVKSQYDIHRDRIRYVLDKLPQIHELRSPKFVLAHIMAPHPPFVFGPLGQARDRDRPFTFGDGSHYYEQGGSPEEYIAGYAGQAAYLSAQVEKLVEELLRTSRTPPVIIVQGDHGPGSGLDWQNAGKTNLFERFSNLSALYLPGCDYSRLSRSMTPVNSFRIIFNRYFGTSFELLPNHNYFTARTRPYLFIEVTDYLAPDGL